MFSAFRLRSFVVLVALMASALFNPVYAEVPEQVGQDFKPLSGYVIMPNKGEFLIDLDAEKGVRVGDIFTSVAPGQKIVHPVSKEVLGTLDEVKGILQVSRLRSGYSHARAVVGGENLQRGDKISRYENIPAIFWDYTGHGEDFFADLKAALPALQWAEYKTAQAQKTEKLQPPAEGGPLLIFALKDTGLEVLDFSKRTLKSYPLSAARGEAAVPPAAIVPTPVAPVPAPGVPAAIVKPKATAPIGSSIIRQEQPRTSNIWRGPDMEGTPVGLEVGDFDGDGAKEVAIAFEDRLEIIRHTQGQFQGLATINLERDRRIIGLDGADLDGNGMGELYLTAAAGEGLASFFIEYQAGQYQPGSISFNWFLRQVQLPEDGPILLGQRVSAEKTLFHGPVFRVGRDGDELVKGGELSLPQLINIYGFSPFKTEGDETLYAALSKSDRLQVFRASGEKLWESEDYYGGSENYLQRPDSVTVGPDLENIFLKARIETLADGTLLVPANKGSRIMASSRTFGKSRLVAMKWDGYSLRELWHTQPQDGYLADFRLADADNDGQDEVVMVVAFSRKGFLSKGRSSLMIFELQ